MCAAIADVPFRPIADIAASHSINSSAATSRPGDTARPSAFAVLRLMTVSYLVGTCTGRSAGLAPRRIRSTYLAAARILIGSVCAVTHQPTGHDEETVRINRGQAVLGRKRDI